MFSVIVTENGSDKIYDHAQRKIAMRQFESYKKRANADYVSVVHNTHKIDEVIAYWERP